MGVGGINSNRGIGGPETEGVGGVKGTTDAGGGSPPVADGEAPPAQFNLARMAASGQAAQLAQMARLLEAEEKGAPSVISGFVGGKQSAQAGSVKRSFSDTWDSIEAKLNKGWDDLAAKAERSGKPFPVSEMLDLVRKTGTKSKAGGVSLDEVQWAEDRATDAAPNGPERQFYSAVKAEYDKQQLGAEKGPLQTKYDELAHNMVTGDKKLTDKDVDALVQLAKGDKKVSAEELAWAKTKMNEAKGTPNEKAAKKLYDALSKLGA